MCFLERSTIEEINANKQGRLLLERYLPKLVRSPSFQMTRCMSFRTVCRFRKWKLTRAKYAEAKEALEGIEIE